MRSAVICDWIADRNFGFAKLDESGAEIFVHLAGFVEPVSTDAIHPGMRIECDAVIQIGKARLRAMNIRVLAEKDSPRVKAYRLERQG
jgi:cold shock CspA family protein